MATFPPLNIVYVGSLLESMGDDHTKYQRCLTEAVDILEMDLQSGTMMDVAPLSRFIQDRGI